MTKKKSKNKHPNAGLSSPSASASANSSVGSSVSSSANLPETDVQAKSDSLNNSRVSVGINSTGKLASQGTPTLNVPTATQSNTNPTFASTVGVDSPERNLQASQKNFPSLTLCMIVKDEEDWIAQAINSVRSIVSEIIVVDTGSTDRTVAIAQSLGAKNFLSSMG